MKKHTIVALDSESILIPEIWPVISNETGIKELAATSREFPDFHELTSRRIQILKEHNLTVADIQTIVEKLEPLSGAPEFLDKLREKYQVVIVSGTLDKFITPFLKKLGYPMVFSFFLETDNPHGIVGFKPTEKHEVIKSLKNLGFNVIGVGDSLNDIEMLKESDTSILFQASRETKAEFPELLTSESYEELETLIDKAAEK